MSDVGEQRGLAADLRKKYQTQLISRNAGWPVAVAIIVGLLLWRSQAALWAYVVLALVTLMVMGVVGQRRTKAVKAMSDALLEDEYRDYRARRWKSTLIEYGLLALLAAGAVYWWQSAGICTPLAVKIEPHVFAINGQMDYGFTLSGDIRNEGKAGRMRLKAELSSSEGNWAKERQLQVEANETLQVRFDFPEPTINSANVQGVLKCW